MRQFFRGWKRKVGVVTLMMACVFMAGWVRSLTNADAMSFGQPNAYQVIILVNAEIRWGRLTPGLNSFGFQWSSTPLIREEVDFQWQEGKVKWRRAFCGFDFGSGASLVFPNHHTERWVIPYWSITFPLTVISLWLLLSKHRKSNQKKITERIPDEKVA